MDNTIDIERISKMAGIIRSNERYTQYTGTVTVILERFSESETLAYKVTIVELVVGLDARKHNQFSITVPRDQLVPLGFHWWLTKTFLPKWEKARREYDNN